MFKYPARSALGIRTYPDSIFPSLGKRLFVVLGQYLLAQLDVLVLGLLLCGAGIDDLLPLIVFGLALLLVRSICSCVPIYANRRRSKIAVLR